MRKQIDGGLDPIEERNREHEAASAAAAALTMFTLTPHEAQGELPLVKCFQNKIGGIRCMLLSIRRED